MTKTTESTQKIDEALSLLNEAAKDKKDEFSGLVKGKYDDLKKVLMDLESDVESQARHGLDKAKDLSHETADRIRRTATKVDDRVHEDPWKTVGWTVVGALVVGFLLGRKD